MRSALEFCGRDSYTQEEFDRFFRRVYQHYGSLEGYDRLPDAERFLAWARDAKHLTLGVTTNTPVRTMETVLPMTGHMDDFRWFVCSQDVGVEKPGAAIFERAYREAQFWAGPLEKDEILHIGDSLEADYCGARAFGFQARLWRCVCRIFSCSVGIGLFWQNLLRKSRAALREHRTLSVECRALLQKFSDFLNFTEFHRISEFQAPLIECQTDGEGGAGTLSRSFAKRARDCLPGLACGARVPRQERGGHQTTHCQRSL